jgi:hypothetical protein
MFPTRALICGLLAIVALGCSNKITLKLSRALLVLFLFVCGCSMTNAPQSPSHLDQDDIDAMISKLEFFEWTPWSNIDKETLIEGLTYIYNQAVSSNDSRMQRIVIHAMGETGLIEFTPILISALNSEPFSACWALSNMPTPIAVKQLIGQLNKEDERTRKGAIWGLEDFPYYLRFPGTATKALAALYNRLTVEEDEFLLEQIQVAIDVISQLRTYSPLPCLPYR